MPKWSDFGGLWSTVRELDTTAIRDDAERPLRIACVGHAAALDALTRLLATGPRRYPPIGPSPLTLTTIPGGQPDNPHAADLLILALDGRVTLAPAEQSAFEQLDHSPVRTLVVTCYGQRPPELTGPSEPLHQQSETLSIRTAAGRTLYLPDPTGTAAASQLATAILEQLPAELHLAAARQLPALRPVYSGGLIGSTAFNNAKYAVATGLPEQIPIFSIPFAAADMVILTKNQIMMTYRLALAHGAPPDFQARIAEIIPVVGGAFVWRQLARSLVGLIPIWGLVPKVAVAYAGTYSTGVAAQQWYANGELINSAQTKQIAQDGLARGRALARDLVARADATRKQAGERVRTSRLGERLRRLLPGGKK